MSAQPESVFGIFQKPGDPGWYFEGEYHDEGPFTKDEAERRFAAYSAAKRGDAVTVGDLKSDKIGTGARKSAGKPDWSQLPWWTVGNIAVAWKELIPNHNFCWGNVLSLLADWQRGDDAALDRAAAMTLGLIWNEAGPHDNTSYDEGTEFPYRSLEGTVRVLEFGAVKYAKGNWAKGMSWSVCFNSAMSHLTKILVGQTHDDESKLWHRDHVMCNLVFLLGYRSRYPEGDDRVPEFQPRRDLEVPHDDVNF